MSLNDNDTKRKKEMREKEEEKNEHMTLDERHKGSDYVSQNIATNHEERSCQRDEKEENAKYEE